MRGATRATTGSASARTPDHDRYYFLFKPASLSRTSSSPRKTDCRRRLRRGPPRARVRAARDTTLPASTIPSPLSTHWSRRGATGFIRGGATTTSKNGECDLVTAFMCLNDINHPAATVRSLPDPGPGRQVLLCPAPPLHLGRRVHGSERQLCHPRALLELASPRIPLGSRRSRVDFLADAQALELLYRRSRGGRVHDRGAPRAPPGRGGGHPVGKHPSDAGVPPPSRKA